MARTKKIVETPKSVDVGEQSTTTQTPETTSLPSQQTTPKTPQPTPTEATLQNLLIKLEKLEKKSIEDSKTIEMLTAVADKGRVFNYESQRSEKKPSKVKLSIFNGKIIIGWKTIRDDLVKHPTTGATVGEKQEYELKLLSKDGIESIAVVDGYPAFSNARYSERIECEVVGKKEDYKGNIEFEIDIPSFGKKILDSRFVN
jgi:hypothetical protein